MTPVTHVETFQYARTNYHRKTVERRADGSLLSHFYDTDGRPNPVDYDKYGSVLTYPVREEMLDDDGNVRWYRLLDTSGRVLKSMMYFIQGGQTIGRAVMGVDSVPVRCPRWEAESYGYYKLYYNTDANNDFVSVRPVDEWETPSVFIDDYDKTYQRVRYREFKSAGYLIQKGQQKISFKTPHYGYVFESADDLSSTSLPYLHILDRRSPLYTVGLRDGDRIVRLGAWHEGGSDTLLAAEWQRLRRDTLPIEVLRPEADGLSKIQRNVHLGADELEEYHIFRLSIAEKSRYDRYKSAMK